MENKLPEGWEWKKLENLYNDGKLVLQNGFACGKNNQNGLGLPQLRPMNVSSDGKIDLTQVKFVEIAKDTSRYLLQKDDVIFNNTNSQELVGKTAVWDEELQESVLSNHMTIIRLSEDSGIFPRYLAKYLHSLWVKRYFEKTCTNHINQSSVGINRLKEIEFPLPPLETQQKIVAILEKAEETKKLRAQADELTQKLLQSVFLEMFGDPVKNLKKWGVEKVQDVISSIEAGWSANGEQRPREENEYAVLKVSAVTRGVFLPEECKVINNDIEFKKVVTPEKGDVLFSRANTLELVGASCLIREDYPYLLLPDKLWKIKVNKEKIYPEYLKFVLSYPTIRSEISKLSTGTSGSMYNISMNKLKLIGITVPPIEIQKNFSIIVETIEKTKEVQKQSSLEINNLFDALMQKAFTGELVS